MPSKSQPRVAAVAISQPQVTLIHGQEVLTSILKKPSSTPVFFTKDGPEGNETAVHPETVYAFVDGHYDFWAQEFGIDRQSWQYGHWGENLTIAGVSEDELKIGDILEIGDTAVMQVTSARVPCFKLAWRIGQPVGILERLIQSGRMGFYLNVLTPGFVKAGDRVNVTCQYPGNINVADLGRLLHAKNMPEGRLREVMKMPGLSRLPTDILRNHINQAIDLQEVRRGHWRGWRDFTLSHIIEEAEDIRSFHLVPSDGGPIAGYRAGQFLTFRITLADGTSLIRTWSISDYDEKSGAYRITVKRLKQGAASTWLHNRPAAGDRLEVKPPAGNFTLDRSGLFRVVLISAGIGITPMISMLKAHLQRGDDSVPPLLWIHTTHNSRTHAFKSEVEELTAAHPHITPHIIYTRPLPEDRIGIDYHQAQRLTGTQITKLLSRNQATIFGRDIELPGQACEVYICGPQDFQNTLVASLQTWGVDATAIHTESFTPLPQDATARGFAGAKVTFAKSGITATWGEDDNFTLLELGEAAGLDLASSCRMGLCHSCECGITTGDIIYDRAGVEGLNAGRALICCSRPASAEVVLDL